MKKMIVALAVLLALAVPASAGTAFLTGEQSTGMTKQCFYDYLGDTYTRTLSSVALCPLSIQVQRTGYTTPTIPAPPSMGGTAFFTGEQTTGMTKQCFYDYLGSAYTKTVSSVTLCPMTVRVSR